MKKGVIVFAILVLILAAWAPSGSREKVVYQTRDSLILLSKIKTLGKFSNLPSGELMIRVGESFLGTPYVGGTLDRDKDHEQLVINLGELDCTTYVENCLAITETLKNKTPAFSEYLKQLERIRYRGGVLNGYASRLHYFCEWIYDNAQKGYLKDVTKEAGGIRDSIRLYYMSTHPKEYPQIERHPELGTKIAAFEKLINSRNWYYIPKERFRESEAYIHDGDIGAITTRIKGMDVSHVGLMIRKNGRIHFMHASSVNKKVEIMDIPLSDYLARRKDATGIMLARVN